MKLFKSYITIGLLAFIVCGCAANKSLYEAPLHDVGVLSDKPRSEWQIEEVTYDNIRNQTPGQRPSLDTTEAGLWMVMDRAEDDLKTSGHLMKDHQLNDYLKSIACKLLPEYCDDIRVYLVQMPYFNATMAPNGAMQIWSGLLLRVQNEAQLAAIIGHELGHYLRRHSLQQIENAIDKAGLLVFVQLATAVAGVPAAGHLAYYITVGSITAFSRNHEREADGYGIALMTRAGYDPREAAKVWGQLIEEKEADDDSDYVPIYLRTHPTSEERYMAIKELSEKVVARGGFYETGENSFREIIFPHRIEFLRDEMNLRDFDRTEKLLDMLIEESADLGELYFFSGELYRLRGEEGDIEKALAEYEKATRAGSPPPEMYRSMGLLYSKLGNDIEAARAFDNYLANRPKCKDREMILHMIKEIKK